jgi:type IV pilus modification protein PilV
MPILGPKCQPESGMTLVEVVIAMAIFAIGILAVGAMQTTSMRSTGTTRDNTEASALAARQLEILIRQSQERREGYYGYLDDPDLQDTDRDGLGGLNDASEAAADHHPTSLHPVYRLYWNVAEDEPMIGTKIIRIIVIWTDRGVERRYPLEYIAVDII